MVDEMDEKYEEKMDDRVENLEELIEKARLDNESKLSNMLLGSSGNMAKFAQTLNQKISYCIIKKQKGSNKKEEYLKKLLLKNSIKKKMEELALK